MTDFDKNLPLAMKLAAVDENFAEPCIWFNGHCINLTDSEDLELLRVLVQHKPLRDQLEELSTNLGDCLKTENAVVDQLSEDAQASSRHGTREEHH